MRRGSACIVEIGLVAFAFGLLSLWVLFLVQCRFVRLSVRIRSVTVVVVVRMGRGRPSSTSVGALCIDFVIVCVCVCLGGRCV